jgi:hypothetical protein
MITCRSFIQTTTSTAAVSAIRLVAPVDSFAGKAQAALDILRQKHEGQVEVRPDQVFTTNLKAGKWPASHRNISNQLTPQ